MSRNHWIALAGCVLFTVIVAGVVVLLFAVGFTRIQTFAPPTITTTPLHPFPVTEGGDLADDEVRIAYRPDLYRKELWPDDEPTDWTDETHTFYWDVVIGGWKEPAVRETNYATRWIENDHVSAGSAGYSSSGAITIGIALVVPLAEGGAPTPSVRPEDWVRLTENQVMKRDERLTLFVKEDDTPVWESGSIVGSGTGSGGGKRSSPPPDEEWETARMEIAVSVGDYCSNPEIRPGYDEDYADKIKALVTFYRTYGSPGDAPEQ